MPGKNCATWWRTDSVCSSRRSSESRASKGKDGLEITLRRKAWQAASSSTIGPICLVSAALGRDETLRVLELIIRFRASATDSTSSTHLCTSTDSPSAGHLCTSGCLRLKISGKWVICDMPYLQMTPGQYLAEHAEYIFTNKGSSSECTSEVEQLPSLHRILG